VFVRGLVRESVLGVIIDCAGRVALSKNWLLVGVVRATFQAVMDIWVVSPSVEMRIVVLSLGLTAQFLCLHLLEPLLCSGSVHVSYGYEV
jgi:hypothetical protein